MTDYPNNTPAKLEIIKASEITPKEVRWLRYPYIPFGKVTLLQGDPGDGKSTMMMNLIAELSKGGKLPDGKAVGLSQRVIYQCSEDGVSDTIKPRLEKCGADCGNVAFINEETYSGTHPAGYYRISAEIGSHRPDTGLSRK